MSAKTFLAVLTNEVSAPHLTAVAAALAAQHNGHLTGLYVMPSMVMTMPVAQHVPPEIIVAAREGQEAEAATIKELFETAAAGETVPTEWILSRADGYAVSDRIVECAHAADIVVVAAETPDTQHADVADVPGQIIRGGGRPVLVVPPTAPAGPIGDSVVIGWSGTREATRAAFDALALLKPGANVTLLMVTSSGTPDAATNASAEALAQTFDRHGHKVEIAHRVTAGHSVAESLLAEAFERGASFIATGAFGHSRTYDFVIGAATRELLTTLNIPVLFSK